MEIINLDHISSNPLLPEVKEAMINAINVNYGNPSSQHRIGDRAAEALESARESVARLINCSAMKEVVFTSGGTESVNHAVKGIALAHSDKGKHIVSSNIEHNAVIRSLRRLKMMGFQVTSIPVDKYGRVNPDHVAKAIREDTILVTIMSGRPRPEGDLHCRYLFRRRVRRRRHVHRPEGGAPERCRQLHRAPRL